MKRLTTASAGPGPYNRLRENASRFFESMEFYAGRFFGEGSSPFALSGAINTALIVICAISGLIMLLFYSPTPQAAASNTHWLNTGPLIILIRGIHRAAADILVLTILFHGLRMWATGRFKGPRARTWVMGLLILPLVGIMGWSGYILKWDADALVLLSWGRGLITGIDHWPLIGLANIGSLISQPVFGVTNQADQLLRIFMLHTGGAFAIVGIIFLHMRLISKPKIRQPLIVWGTIFLVVLLVAVMMPVERGGHSVFNPFDPPSFVKVDIFLMFPMLFYTLIGGPLLAFLLTVFWLLTASLPSLEKKSQTPAVVIESFCTGCRMCLDDCPYEAIEMVPAKGRKANRNVMETAQVIGRNCSSCGICVGSCEHGAIELPDLTSEDIQRSIGLALSSHTDEKVGK